MKWIGCCVLGLVVGFALGRLLPSGDDAVPDIRPVEDLMAA